MFLCTRLPAGVPDLCQANGCSRCLKRLFERVMLVEQIPILSQMTPKNQKNEPKVDLGLIFLDDWETPFLVN